MRLAVEGATLFDLPSGKRILFYFGPNSIFIKFIGLKLNILLKSNFI